MSGATTISCPYCGDSWAQIVRHPELPKRLPRGSQPVLAPAPTDVRTVPYVRDVGTFDPRPGSEWRDPGRGTWVGSDFMPIMRFDERFGILTSKDRQWPQVVYRVERCASCLHHFDAYYSFHEDHRLPDQFPHLFAAEGKPLTIPSHAPLPAVFVDLLSPTRLTGRYALAVAAGLWWAVAALFMALLRLRFDQFSWLEYGAAVGSLLLGVFAAAFLLARLLDVLAYFSDQAPMDRVIVSAGGPGAPNIDNGVRHWISFTRCRFTGRPDGDGREARARGTTTEVLGGLISVVSLLVVVLLTGDTALHVLLPRLTDALFWLPVAFMVGSGLQIGANTVHYVLAGLTRVPLRLDEVHPTEDLPVIREIQRYVKSTGTCVALLLVSLVAINTAIRGLPGGSSPLAWVDLWFLFILVIGLVVLGWTQRVYLFFAVIVIVVTIGLHDADGVPVPLTTSWHLDPVTLWLGLVFTVMLVVETTATNRLVEKAIRNSLESRAARLMRDAPTLTTEEIHQARAAVDAARVVVDMRSGVTTSAALAPLIAGVVLPAALDSLIASL